MVKLDENPILKLNQGQVRGRISKNVTGVEFYSFCGIPYAKPPVGKLRFKYPEETEWSGVLDGTKEGEVSVQCDLLTKEFSGSEDCLFVNIHLPKLDDSDIEKLPIMVYIHGGGFIAGSGNIDEFGPDYLLENNVIFVSMNYRLGVLGFLCTDPVNARGDMGLMDQNLALKWIKNNALNFGGDPDNITIVGISAGAASVEYHVLAEQSNGLFHKAIAQAGSVLCPFARNRDPMKYAERLAKVLGRTTDDDDLFHFINKFSGEELAVASMQVLDLEDVKKALYMAFVPAVNVFQDGKGFINDEPSNILKQGQFNKVPMLTGFNAKEGKLMKFAYLNPVSIKDLSEKNYLKYIPGNLNQNFHGGNERLKEVYQLKLEDRNPDDDMIDFISDVAIISGVFCSLDHRLVHVQDGQFFYMFSYEGNLNLQFNIHLTETQKGASHADEQGYLATSNKIIKQATEEDVALKDLMVKMWTNFMKFGDPTPGDFVVKWKSVTKDKFQYLSIGSKIEMGEELFPERRKLWKEIYATV